MIGRSKECLPAVPSFETLDILTRKRIYEPVVGELYEEFVRNGTYQSLQEILTLVPCRYRSPIVYTLITHVTKEKPIFVYGIGKHFIESEEKVQFVAASVDLLWCLSLIVDDLFDEDTQRANMGTAWYVFGKEYVYDSAEATFGILQSETEKRLSAQAKDLLAECVSEGMLSLRDPAIRSLDTSVEEILHNIKRRARFHCEYPIRALFSENQNGGDQLVGLLSDGLFCVNRAGQILNDVKDLTPSSIYGRNLFSDISCGTSTVPLIMLYKELDDEEKSRFKSCFGNPAMTLAQTGWLSEVVDQRLPREKIHSVVLENYEMFLQHMKAGVNSDYLAFCQKWVDYKEKQVEILLLNS